MQIENVAEGYSIQISAGKRWRVVIGAFLALTVCYGPIMQYSFGVFIKPLSEAFHIDRATMSLAPTLAILIIGAALPATGFLVDRFGAKRVALVAISLTAINIMALGIFSRSAFMFIALYCLTGVWITGYSPLPFARVVASLFTRRRGLALGFTMGGVGCGAAIIPLVAEWLISNLGWRNAYVGLGVIIFLVAAPSVYLTMAEEVSENRTKSGDLPQAGIDGREILRNSYFWRFGIAFLLVALCTAGVLTHIAAMLSDRGISPMVAASAISVVGIALIFGRILSGFLVDKIFAPLIAVTFFIFPIIGLILLTTTKLNQLALLAAAFTGLGVGAEVDLIAYLISRYFGQKSFGIIFGYLLAMFTFGAAFGPLLMGLSFSIFGTYNPAMFAFIGLLSIACILMSRVGPYRYS